MKQMSVVNKLNPPKRKYGPRIPNRFIKLASEDLKHKPDGALARKMGVVNEIVQLTI